MADIISTLPDAILGHILSFLQTDQSVVTSILSKRWNHLWLSVPSLYFKTTITSINHHLRFHDTVYSLLLSRDSSYSIKSFRFKVVYDYPEYFYLDGPDNTIIKWVNFLVQRGVEYLSLNMSVTGWDTQNYLARLPITILTCKTLVVLKLVSFRVDKSFSSVSVALPSLKSLRLQYIYFPKHRDFMLFLTACPILEDLLTYSLLFNSEESLTFNEWENFCLSNLTHADIDCFHGHLTLKAVHNVSSMRFEIEKVHFPNDFIPTFLNLTQLELTSLNYSWQFLLQVLNHCPKLQKLELDLADPCMETWTRKDDKENWVDPSSVPQCLSLHLTTCNLFNFLGLQDELLLTRYILKNAKVLQTMKIWNYGQVKVRGLLCSYPRASAVCKVTLYGVQCKL